MQLGRGVKVGSDDGTERARAWREAATMVLYVSIVLLAELAALPEGHNAEGTRGPVGWALIAIFWGTTMGLVLAHWFAFHIATQGLSSGRPRDQHRAELVAQLTGAGLVAVIASLAVLLLSPDGERQDVPFVLASIIGIVGYLVERANGRSRTASLVFAASTLAVGLAIAGVKTFLSYH
ncbi:MAG: hypothetical protein E6G60_00255 [Actinobacteria bacterium]|nr:MAG: hypothetical protein E6G60_00255 [Actinomycetota bacterium]